MKKLLLLLLLGTTPAFAADWSGPYAGINAGYGRANFSGDGFSENASGLVGGAQLGYNFQFDKIIVGVETDFQFVSQKATQNIGTLSFTERLNWFGTARGRIGYAFERFMPYVTGGAALANVSLDASGPGGSLSDSTSRWGYALGAGLDYAITQRFVARIEYLHVDTGSQSVEMFGVTGEARLRENLLRLALNYRF